MELALWVAGVALLCARVPIRVVGGVLLLAALGRAMVAWSRLSRRFMVVTVRGQSMEPTFSEGDRVLIRRGQRLQAGDVVVLRTAAARSTAAARPSCVIKRVAAVAGEVVPPYIGPAGDRVPTGRLVLLGDNRSASFDSRQVGYFRIDDLLGTVVRRLGSPSAPPRRNAQPTDTQHPVARLRPAKSVNLRSETLWCDQSNGEGSSWWS
ncbi:S26 family signal peptidase [Micromonospora sp. NPDC005172]|uniref:S26 family signal peptidase n=1 Tax=Micromonospora sp. NPDC005172 TaxID=3156867 RepID=UPI0033A5C25C